MCLIQRRLFLTLFYQFRLGILTYPTVQAPRYKRGYAYSFSCAIALIIFTHVLDNIFRLRRYDRLSMVFDAIDNLYIHIYSIVLTSARKRDAKRAAEATDEVRDDPVSVDSSADEPSKGDPHTIVTKR